MASRRAVCSKPHSIALCWQKKARGLFADVSSNACRLFPRRELLDTKVGGSSARCFLLLLTTSHDDRHIESLTRKRSEQRAANECSNPRYACWPGGGGIYDLRDVIKAKHEPQTHTFDNACIRMQCSEVKFRSWPLPLRYHPFSMSVTSLGRGWNRKDIRFKLGSEMLATVRWWQGQYWSRALELECFTWTIHQLWGSLMSK